MPETNLKKLRIKMLYNNSNLKNDPT